MSTQAFSLAPEPISGDSLTQYLRSLTDSLGSSGGSTFQAGQNIFQQGVQSFAAPLQYYQDILSGDKSKMEAATATEKSDILSQYRARRRQQASGPRGGGTNAAVASSEYAEAGDVAGLLGKLRPQAAAGEAGIASEIAGLGAKESALGNEQLFQALSGLMSRRGQNVSQDQSNLGFLSSGLQAVFNALI